MGFSPESWADFLDGVRLRAESDPRYALRNFDRIGLVTWQRVVSERQLEVLERSRRPVSDSVRVSGTSEDWD